ncbi:sensor domain-containing diguanylate cyclase [Mangrovibacter plantisponsor]|uniref:diguanylate cyclase n=1 Tax=Mangrovibacter plantisponsor TaxID=451513 RepID=A0A317Q919_9ENTR|nr:sensor domain-containing diguanylate cyclase [Mangrovibacter plantisponsor]PWW10826.1 diguanylate cyclase (GGDEF)-like protein [Mangrovibacter plantisponsor]
MTALRTMKLNLLLTWMSIGAVVLTGVLLLTSLYFYQKANIEHTILENNNAYARKLAETADRVIGISQQELAYSASKIHSFSDYQTMVDEADRLRLQSGFFNSVIVVNDHGIILATSPESLNLRGIGLQSEANANALKTRKPYISQPFFTGTTNRYVIFVSSPVFDHAGNYLGYIGGSIYLKEKSILNQIISTHFYNYSANVSIVSNDGHIIFNKDPNKVGSQIGIDDQLKKMLSQNVSGAYVVNHGEATQLLGVGNLTKTDWNVFVYADDTLVNDIMLSTIRQSVWFIILILVFTSLLSYALSTLIARPLRRLAILSASKPTAHVVEEIRQIDAWYYEANKLKVSISAGMVSTIKQVKNLDREASTDPLTGLLNRRGFMTLASISGKHSENALISLDLDHFKRVNDTWGHDTGDKVLVMVSSILKTICRETDLVGRFGGEEFVIMLPGTSTENAEKIADRIRCSIEQEKQPQLPSVTISAGIAALEDADNIDEAIKMTDIALYEAKDKGRNRVVLYRSVCPLPQTSGVHTASSSHA